MLKSNKKIFVVAEIGNNHEGNFILAKNGAESQYLSLK